MRWANKQTNTHNRRSNAWPTSVVSWCCWLLREFWRNIAVETWESSFTQSHINFSAWILTKLFGEANPHQVPRMWPRQRLSYSKYSIRYHPFKAILSLQNGLPWCAIIYSLMDLLKLHCSSFPKYLENFSVWNNELNALSAWMGVFPQRLGSRWRRPPSTIWFTK